MTEEESWVESLRVSSWLTAWQYIPMEKDILSRGQLGLRAGPLGSVKAIGRLESGCLNYVEFWS